MQIYPADILQTVEPVQEEAELLPCPYSDTSGDPSTSMGVLHRSVHRNTTNEVKASLGMDVPSIVHCVYIIDQSKYTAKYNMEQLLDDTISNYYQAYGSTATILRLDGEPKVVDHLSYEDNGKGGSGAWKEKDRQEAVSLIIDSIGNCNELPF